MKKTKIVIAGGGFAFTKVRDRVVGILFRLVVTAVVFHYIWQERVADRIQNRKEVS